MTDPTAQTVGSYQGRRVTIERDSSLEFEFFWATVVSFRWGLLLRDRSDEGNVTMLTLIGGEWQRSPAMVRRLGRCLAMVRVASGEASAPWTCTKASSSSLLASQLTNCSERGGKLEFGGYLGFSGFLTCGQKFALYVVLYIEVFR
jgi:hypothetical protein